MKSPSIKPAACTPSVSTKPGLIELTRICFEPSSFAKTPVTASTAPLVADNTQVDGGVCREATDPILITLPPRSPKYFTASRVARMRPSTLVLNYDEIARLGEIEKRTSKNWRNGNVSSIIR